MSSCSGRGMPSRAARQKHKGKDCRSCFSLSGSACDTLTFFLAYLIVWKSLELRLLHPHGYVAKAELLCRFPKKSVCMWDNIWTRLRVRH